MQGATQVSRASTGLKLHRLADASRVITSRPYNYVQFSSVQFSSVQFSTSLGIILFLRSLYSKFSSVFFDHYIQNLVQFSCICWVFSSFFDHHVQSSVYDALVYLVWTLLGWFISDDPLCVVYASIDHSRRGAAELIIKPCPLAARICCTFIPTTFSSVQFSSRSQTCTRQCFCRAKNPKTHMMLLMDRLAHTGCDVAAAFSRQSRAELN